jgi:hypothetical protein
MSHLRVIHFDAAGDELATGPVSTAVLPAYVLSTTAQRGVRSLASGYLGKSGGKRRWDGAIVLLRRELMRTPTVPPRFYGIALVSCPGRESRIRIATGPVTLTAKNSYCAAFVALGGGNRLVAGELEARSFRALMGEVSRRVRAILQTRIMLPAQAASS